MELYEKKPAFCRQWPVLRAEWEKTYAGVDLLFEARKAHTWMLANPHRPKKLLAKFLNNWLASAARDLKNGNGKTEVQRAIEDVERLYAAEEERKRNGVVG